MTNDFGEDEWEVPILKPRPSTVEQPRPDTSGSSPPAPPVSAQALAKEREAQVRKMGARPEDVLPKVDRAREERDARILAQEAEEDPVMPGAVPAASVGERIATALEEIASALNVIAASKV